MQRQKKHQILTLVLLTALVSGTAWAAPQRSADGATKSFGEMIEVSEVLLDVLVTDRKGNVVVDLDVDDFIIEENGQPVQPNSVSFYSNRFKLQEGQVGVQRPAPNEVPTDRHLILFFHDPRDFRLTQQLLEATRRSQTWVREQMLPGDWVAVVSYDVKLKVHQDFTQDSQALLRALQDAAKGKDAQKWKSRQPELVEGQPSLRAHLPEGKELRRQTTRIYDGLGLLAEATEDIVGRKNLLLFTIGFGDVRTRGSAVTAALASNYYSEPDRRYYPQLEQALNDNNVAVYPIDLAYEQRLNIQADFLNKLAADSGGHYYENFTNFLSPIRRVTDESNGYYLLSYEAAHPSGEVGYREVVVKARNPEFKVRARKGYRYGT